MDQLFYDKRYLVEHVILPKDFYEHSLDYICIMINGNGRYVFDVLSDLIQNEGGKMPYAPEDFAVRIIKADDKQNSNTYILAVTFPEPQKEPLCYSAVGIFDMNEKDKSSFQKGMYFTVEQGAGDEPAPMLCSWNSDGTHSDYGEVSGDIIVQIGSALEIYRGR